MKLRRLILWTLFYIVFLRLLPKTSALWGWRRETTDPDLQPPTLLETEPDLIPSPPEPEVAEIEAEQSPDPLPALQKSFGEICIHILLEAAGSVFSTSISLLIEALLYYTYYELLSAVVLLSLEWEPNFGITAFLAAEPIPHPGHEEPATFAETMSTILKVLLIFPGSLLMVFIIPPVGYILFASIPILVYNLFATPRSSGESPKPPVKPAPGTAQGSNEGQACKPHMPCTGNCVDVRPAALKVPIMPLISTPSLPVVKEIAKLTSVNHTTTASPVVPPVPVKLEQGDKDEVQLTARQTNESAKTSDIKQAAQEQDRPTPDAHAKELADAKIEKVAPITSPTVGNDKEEKGDVTNRHGQSSAREAFKQAASETTQPESKYPRGPHNKEAGPGPSTQRTASLKALLPQSGARLPEKDATGKEEAAISRQKRKQEQRLKNAAASKRKPTELMAVNQSENRAPKSSIGARSTNGKAAVDVHLGKSIQTCSSKPEEKFTQTQPTELEDRCIQTYFNEPEDKSIQTYFSEPQEKSTQTFFSQQRGMSTQTYFDTPEDKSMQAYPDEPMVVTKASGTSSQDEFQQHRSNSSFENGLYQAVAVQTASEPQISTKNAETAKGRKTRPSPLIKRFARQLARQKTRVRLRDRKKACTQKIEMSRNDYLEAAMEMNVIAEENAVELNAEILDSDVPEWANERGDEWIGDLEDGFFITSGPMANSNLEMHSNSGTSASRTSGVDSSIWTPGGLGRTDVRDIIPAQPRSNIQAAIRTAESLYGTGLLARLGEPVHDAQTSVSTRVAVLNPQATPFKSMWTPCNEIAGSGIVYSTEWSSERRLDDGLCRKERLRSGWYA